MVQSVDDIKGKFGGKLVGKPKMQRLVCETLLLFTDSEINHITKNIWFVSSFDDAWGFVLDSKDLGKKHLVFLGDELFDQDKYAQQYTIAHEIGHVLLNHRNAILQPQTGTEIKNQEDEAHRFAIQYVGVR